ncbi:hypothetical protein JOM56_007999 [Amanita muscaria]
MMDNFASKPYRPGSVGYVSKAGDMSNELNNIPSATVTRDPRWLPTISCVPSKTLMLVLLGEVQERYHRETHLVQGTFERLVKTGVINPRKERDTTSEPKCVFRERSLFSIDPCIGTRSHPKASNISIGIDSLESKALVRSTA